MEVEIDYMYVQMYAHVCRPSSCRPVMHEEGPWYIDMSGSMHMYVYAKGGGGGHVYKL